MPAPISIESKLYRAANTWLLLLLPHRRPPTAVTHCCAIFFVRALVQFEVETFFLQLRARRVRYSVQLLESFLRPNGAHTTFT